METGKYFTTLPIEKGQRFVPNYKIALIAKFFNVTTDELLGSRVIDKELLNFGEKKALKNPVFSMLSTLVRRLERPIFRLGVRKYNSVESV